MLRLITIPISHFCEKARWALDRAGLEYREERHVQGFSVVAARRAGGALTTPVLVTPERVLADSMAILGWVDARTPAAHRLFPAEPATRREVAGLCARLDRSFGPRGRRLMYVHMLDAPDVMLRFNNEGVPDWQARALRAGWPAAVKLLERRLAIRADVATADEAAVWRELDVVAELLADGRPYLSGERFGAADLTFAALSAAVVVPPDYGVPLPPLDELPPRIAELVARFREHPAGRFALRLFADHRREVVAGEARTETLDEVLARAGGSLALGSAADAVRADRDGH